MKIGIITDIHSNINALNVVLNKFDKIKIDKIICCGDVIGIGPNPEETIQALIKRKDILLAVRGNHEQYLLKGLPKKIHDDNNGLDYVLVGDYYLPVLSLPEETRPIGCWGMLRKEYLKEHKSGMYSCLLLTARLDSHLADVNEQAQERFELIEAQMRSAEGVTEDLKAQNPMEWVRRANNIRNRAQEIVLNELVYV